MDGSAFAGSQRQIQLYVNRMTGTLNTEIATGLGLMAESIQWVSPLASESYNEYRDGEFLDTVSLPQFKSELRNFWPAQGPCWDALAVVQHERPNGVLIVEAKSHLAEMEARCSAKSEKSLEQIRNAFRKTKEWIGVSDDSNWFGSFYQMANRYCFLYFLREVIGVQAWLANVYIVGDSICPTSQEQWARGITCAKEQLGVVSVPYSADVFLEAIPANEIANRSV